MNKTFLLLDVTRTYQVTDSAFELRGDTVQEDETEKMNFLLCIFSFWATRRDTCANVPMYVQVQVQHMDAMKEIDFGSVL